VKYFLDPYRSIQKITGCKLNERHSGLKSYVLERVYENVVGLPLENAHSSLIDAKAQISVVLSEGFRRVFATKNSVTYISEMFLKKDKRRMDAMYEP